MTLFVFFFCFLFLFSPVAGVEFQTIAAAILGGTASVLGGGKFANGAVSGAFTYLFNNAAHEAESNKEAAGMTADDVRKYILNYAEDNPGEAIPLTVDQLKIIMLADLEFVKEYGYDKLSGGEFVKKI